MKYIKIFEDFSNGIGTGTITAKKQTLKLNYFIPDTEIVPANKAQFLNWFHMGKHAKFITAHNPTITSDIESGAADHAEGDDFPLRLVELIVSGSVTYDDVFGMLFEAQGEYIKKITGLRNVDEFKYMWITSSQYSFKQEEQMISLLQTFFKSTNTPMPDIIAFDPDEMGDAYYYFIANPNCIQNVKYLGDIE